MIDCVLIFPLFHSSCHPSAHSPRTPDSSQCIFHGPFPLHSICFWVRPSSLPIRATAEASWSPSRDEKADKWHPKMTVAAGFWALPKSPCTSRAARQENRNLGAFKTKLDEKTSPERQPPAATRATRGWCLHRGCGGKPQGAGGWTPTQGSPQVTDGHSLGRTVGPFGSGS